MLVKGCPSGLGRERGSDSTTKSSTRIPVIMHGLEESSEGYVTYP